MHLYGSYYTQLGFERAGLFQAIQHKYPCRDVLYPGCSVHITPSLYFPHVVYVDQSNAATTFFANEESVAEFVSRNKHYKQSAFPVRVTAFEPNRTLVLTGGMPLGLFKSERTHTLIPGRDGQTTFKTEEIFSGLLLPIFGRTIPALTENFRAFAAGLKRQAENSM